MRGETLCITSVMVTASSEVVALLVPSTDLRTVPPTPQDAFTSGRMGTDATAERGRPQTHPRWRRRAGDDGLNTLFSHTYSASDPLLDLTTRWTRHSFYWTH